MKALVAVFATAILAFAPAAGAQQIIGPQNPDDPQVDSPWQAGTCKADPPAPKCSVATPELFYEEAGGHPPKGFTQFIVNTEAGPPLGPRPIGDLRTIRVDLPVGLTVNPQATPQCDLGPESEGDPATCPPSTQVGISEVTATHVDTGLSVTVPPVPVYNVVPKAGEPARFGFSVAGSKVFLEADVAWENDFHEYFTIHVHPVSLPLILEGKARIAKNRLTFDGMAGDGTFITTPTTCLGGAPPASANSRFEHVYSTWLRADSYQDEDPNFPNGSAYVEAKIPPGTSPKRCEDIPFDPSIEVNPNTGQTDSPSGATVTVRLPEIKNPTKSESAKATSHVRSARVTLPAGMGLNPSAASGLAACTDEQFGKGKRVPIACPPASQIGTVAVDSPPLPDGSLTGAVYVGSQRSNDPASGELYRIFVSAESARYDILARLVGNVRADPVTGQLTTVLDGEVLTGNPGSVPLKGLPQVPFETFQLKFNGGPKAPLTSPPTCGPNTTTSSMTPWSSAVGQVPPGGDEGPSTDPPATPSSAFSLSSLPGGGACPKTLGARPFSPSFATNISNHKGGDFTELTVRMARPDGQQELKRVDITLPPGHTAKLAGLKYCPASRIAAAAASSGAAETASASCPRSSFIGTADVKAGSGSQPLAMSGKAFLAGPYKGAPLSLAVVTPATAGPFDLGTVVVRVALHVNRRTAQIRAVSDPIPHVYGGALLNLRSVVVRTTRPRFSINPTNCSPLSTEGTLGGGGSNPLSPAAFSAFPVSSSLQASGCQRLRFKPRLFLRLFGAMKRAKNPKLRAVFLTRKSKTNPARVAVTLPRSLFLDQSNLSKVCTRVQYEANDCPKKSRYGHARAFTPLLDKPLKGPVFLRSSDNELPDLVASLRGQVDIDLVGRIDAVKGRIRNTFDVVPDVPVSKFVLTMRGGKKGLLTNSRDQCATPKADKAKDGKRKRSKAPRALVRIKAHNGKKANQRPKVRTACGKKKGKRGKRR
ncbi:MAG TPA: hypothetical protein VHF50_01120 [Solirubrobacterales bacterium]|nr:hypothetical protein [Solirubrobacterales bacterium]